MEFAIFLSSLRHLGATSLTFAAGGDCCCSFAQGRKSTSTQINSLRAPQRTWAKWGRFFIFPVLCLLLYGTLLSSPSNLVFTSIWDLHLGRTHTHTKRGVTMTRFVLFFPTSGYFGTPKTLPNKGKHKMNNRPCFAPRPPHSPPVWIPHLNFLLWGCLLSWQNTGAKGILGSQIFMLILLGGSRGVACLALLLAFSAERSRSV